MFRIYNLNELKTKSLYSYIEMNAEIQIQNQNNYSSASAGGGGIIVRNRNNSSQSNVSMELEAFLATRRLKTGETYTHSRIKGSKGSWVIQPEDLPEFHRLYFAKIGSGAEDYLVERQTGNALYIDLDFKYVVGTEKHQHQFADIVAVCEKVVEICGIKYGFRLQNGESFKVFIMEKHMPDWGPDVTWSPVKGSPQEPVVKSGVHIQFCFKIPKYILKPLYQDILAELNGGLLNLPVINTWGDVLDKGVFEQGTNNILYGSIKAPGAKRYTLTKRCLEYVQQEGDNILGGPIATPTFSSANFSGISTNCAENVQPHWIEEEVVVPVPVRVARASAVAGGAIGSDAESVATSNAPIGDSSPEEYDCVAEYIREGLLSRYVTSGQYKEWVNLGYALYASFGQVRGLVLWKLLSVERETDPAIGNRPDAQWAKICGSFNTVATGLGAIHARAKSSNEKKQRVIYVKNIGSKVNLYSAIFSTGLIADYFKKLHADKFIFCDDKSYYYNGIFWEGSDKKDSILVNFFDKTFVPELRAYGMERQEFFNSKREEADTDEEKEKFSKLYESVLVFLGKVEQLRNNAKRKPIIEDITCFLTNNKIDWDNQNHLFAFTNTVIDLNTGEFVEPQASFYISKTCGYAYDFDYAETKVQDIRDLLSQIFVQEDIRTSYCVALSTGLYGVQQENLFIATGVGRNGKGVLNGLMLKTVGDYGIKLANTLMLQPLKTGANPEIATLHNKRFGLFVETDSTKKLCSATIKEITGDKTIQARTGYDFSGRAVNLKVSLFMEANDLPKFDEVVQGVCDRAYLTKFMSRFLQQSQLDSVPEEDRAGHFLLSVKFKDDTWIAEHKQGLFMVLLDYFQIFKANDYKLPPMPEVCAKECSHYLASSDNVFNWIQEFYNQVPIAQSVPIPLTTIFALFSDSQFFRSMNKADQRAWGRKHFCEKLCSNMYMKPYIFLKGKSHRGKQVKADSVVGWELINLFAQQQDETPELYDEEF